MKAFLSALVLFCASIQSAVSATYYVAPTGNDGNAGSIAAPFRTISRGVSKAVAGDTVYVRGGTYREDVEMSTGGSAGNPIRVLAYAGEIPLVKGSDVVTGWVKHNGAIWKKTGWQSNSQQVFVDFDAAPGKSLQQIGMPASHYTSWEYPSPVGSNVNTMIAGSFYYEKASATLYVWLKDGSDPNSHAMEVSTRRRVFFMSRPYVQLKGFAFRHSNTSAFAQQGAAVELSSHSSIEDCDIEYMDFAGLGLGYQQDGASAIHCNVSNNGNTGVNAVSATNFVVSGMKLNNNNSRNFNTLWHAGGFKAATDSYGTVRDSEISFNNGSGVWFDFCDTGKPIVIRNNYIHDNGPKEAAVFFEVSANGLITNNVISRNQRRGVYVSASRNTQVVNNTIEGTLDRAAIELAGMPRGTATLTDNVVQNNIISGTSAQYDLYIQPDSGTSIARNKSDFNLFYRSSGVVQLWKGTMFGDLSTWNKSTGNDLRSVRSSPLFVSGAASGALKFALQTGSPAIDTGMAGVSVDDYLYAKRPSGKGMDMGAFEKVDVVTAPPPPPTGGADTVAPVVTVTPGVLLHSGGKPRIVAKAVDNVAVTKMSIYIDGVNKANAPEGYLSYNWTNASAGAHQLKITAIDAAGNLATWNGTITVVLD
jgi:parallel beta-helix repeat protein